MRQVCRTLLFALAIVASSAAPDAQQTRGATDAVGLVGTWTLLMTEQGVDGAQPVRVQTPRGLLVFDAAGHVFETITRGPQTTAAGRGRGAGAGGQQAPPQPLPAAPTLTPAQTTVASYAGFWGGYTVDAAKKSIVYQPQGAVSPSLMGRAITRTFELQGDRLLITSTPGEPQVTRPTRWTWERVPPVEGMGPTYRKVMGFWQHVTEKRINLTTNTTTSETTRAPSLIVYTPAGYVGVHFFAAGRKPFAGAEPTDEEARQALSGMVDYFGALSVYPDMVFHQILAGSGNLSAGGTSKRPLEMNGAGTEVTIKFPPTRNEQGQETTTHVVLRRLSGEADMMPRR